MRKEIKVLQIITKAEWAGAQRVVYEICKISKEYQNLKIEVATGENGILVDKLEKDLGIKVHVLKNLIHPINAFIDYKGYKEIERLIRENHYDVVHCHSTKAGILGRLAANKVGVKRIIRTVHGYWPILQYHGIRRKMAIFLERYLAKRTTDLVLISKSDVELSKRMKIGDEEKYRLIYNRITVEKDKIENGLLRKELNVDNNIRIIGNVARVDNQKNPFLFIDIANEYLKENNDVLFVWVGDGSLIQQAKDYVEKLNLKEKVKFIGFRQNGIEYMKDFDLLLLTSNWEGVPITILEAIELKIPILSTDVGGIKEIIGKNSVFGMPYSISEICKMIDKKLNSREIIEYNFDNFSDYIKLYSID